MGFIVAWCSSSFPCSEHVPSQMSIYIYRLSLDSHWPDETSIPFPWPGIHPESIPSIPAGCPARCQGFCRRTVPSTSSCLSGPARRAARCCRCSGPSPDASRRASLTEKPMTRARFHRESMGKCWNMMINDEKLRVWSGIFEGEYVFRRGHMDRRADIFKDSWFCWWWLIVFGGGDGQWMSMGRCLFHFISTSPVMFLCTVKHRDCL